MTITNVPNTKVEQVQLIIGDEDAELIATQVIQYILDSNNQNVNTSSLEALRYIVSSLTAKVDEEVGEVKVKWSQLLDNYKKLLKDLLTNPAMQLVPTMPYFGGTNKTEADRVYDNSDSRGAPLPEGFFTSTDGNTTVHPEDRNHVR